MSENEKEQVVESTESVAEETPVEEKTTASPEKKSLVRVYALAILIVLIVLAGVLFKLEKEDRSSTNLFGTLIEYQANNVVVARVNGADIINSELDNSIEQFSQLAIAQGVDMSGEEAQIEVRTQALDVLVNTTLLKQEAKERGLSIEDADVASRIQEITNELGGEEVLNERMEVLGIDATKLQSDVKEELLIRGLLDLVFAESDISVTEEEVVAVYESAGGADAGLPALEEVREQVEAQIISSKEQVVIDSLLENLKEESEVEIL
jgi:hypothetical protein